MAYTAVGLFEHHGIADLAVQDLGIEGFQTEAIRVLSEPVDMPVDSGTSSPGTDFAASLRADLHSMGATEDECDAYLAGIRNGNVLVFATGTAAEADRAAHLMATYEPLELEEFAGATPALPSVHVGEIGATGISLKEDRIRAKSGGAKIFTW